MRLLKTNDIEIFVQIKGYEGYYEISNYGNVKSLSRRIPRNGKGDLVLKERIIKNHITNKGYFVVTLCKNYKLKTFSIHRLVGLAFIEDNKILNNIDHIDCNKLNNYYKNLQWVTKSENVLLAWKNGLHDESKFTRGVKSYNCSISEAKVVSIKKMISEGNSIVKIQTELCVSQNIIYSIKAGKTWKHISL